MKPEHREKLIKLKRGIEQLNKKLFVDNLILSMAIASILAIVIDYLWDLRVLVFIIWFVFLTYVSFKLILEIKFSRIRKGIDVNQNVDEGYKDEIKEGFISIKFGKYKVKLNFKDCVYVLTDDFVFAFQSFRILAIFIIDKTKSKKELEDFLSKFKKQRNLKLTSAIAILIVILSFAFKISLIILNQNSFNDEFTYQVHKISIGDSIIYDNSDSEFIILTTNFLTDECPENNVVKFHCRNEYFKRIRLIYRSFKNSDWKTEQKFGDKYMGTYSYQMNSDKIFLFKDDIQITIEKKLKRNPAPNSD